MSAASDALLRARRVCSRRGRPAHLLLEIAPGASLDDAQAAFHAYARVAHPDLYRNNLTAEELELLTDAYAAIAGAYQEFRTHARTQPMRPVERAGAGKPRAPSPSPAPGANAAAAMSSKALLYYRKAELALRRGDLKSAVLQLKLAIAADPHSALLRTALAEVRSEIDKAT